MQSVQPLLTDASARYIQALSSIRLPRYRIVFAWVVAIPHTNTIEQCTTRTSLRADIICLTEVMILKSTTKKKDAYHHQPHLPLPFHLQPNLSKKYRAEQYIAVQCSERVAGWEHCPHQLGTKEIDKVKKTSTLLTDHLITG